jgi:hypothetical protein
MKSKNKTQFAAICLAILSLLGFTGYSFVVMAEEISPQQQIDRKAVEKGLDESLGMPVLKGDLWKKMTHDEKVAFIWGFGHVVSIEYYLMEKFPELKRDSFVAKAVVGMDNTPMNEVVARVDRYYDMHPEDFEKPVTSVLWDTMIRPNIKTGIAGQPLKSQQ